MSKSVKILCDGCERDITYTGNSIDYRLTLRDEEKPNYPGCNMVTDMMIYPSLKGGEKNFCGIGCLKTWIAGY
jgi:hypothetical protein